MPYAAARFPSFVHGKRELLARRRRLRPAVVLEHEDRRHRPELREVHRLVERARVRRAVAEERHGDALLAAHLERERRSDDAREPTAHDGVRAEVADLEVVQVHRAAVPAAAAFDLPVQLGHDPLDRSPLRDRMPVRAVRRRDHVLAVQMRRRRPSRSPPDRSRHAGSRAARPRGSGPRPSPRTGG